MSASKAVPAGLTIILGVLTAVGPFSLDAYLPSFPTIAEELSASPQQVQLSLTTCLIGLALGQLFVGPWGDRVGRRAPLLIGSIGYLFASLACAFAGSIEIFIVLRFIQGFAGAAGLVMARAVVRDLASGRAAITLYSRLAVVSGLAPVVAPVLGAFALAFVSWRGVFVGLAVLGAILTLLVAALLPETHHKESRTSGSVIETFRAFGHLLRDKAFAGYVVVGGLAAVILFGYISSSSFVLQTVYGATAGQFAAAFAVNGLGLAAMGQVNGRLAHRFGAPFMLRLGILIQAAGTFALAAFVLFGPSGEAALLPTAALLFFAVAPLGFILPNAMAIGMGQSGKSSGTASAILGVTTFLFGALVSPISGAGDPAVVMVIVMAVASVASVALVYVLKYRVTLLED